MYRTFKNNKQKVCQSSYISNSFQIRSCPDPERFFPDPDKVPDPVTSGSSTMANKLKFLEISSLSLNFVDMDTDPDRQALDADTDSAK
jgi:hypothetical protein